ncbi:MAG: cyclopropane-fatty-acyl-phospholipid synthase family protein [Pseudomonadota bacterium]
MATKINKQQADIARRADTRRVAKRAYIENIARRGVLASFSRLENARVCVRENGDSHTFGQPSERFPTPVVIDVSDPRAWPEIAFFGALGSGEAFMRNWWHTSQLTELVRVLLYDRHVLDGLENGLVRLARPLLKMWYRLHRNTRSGSRRNIQAHYDLGDEFFELFLDETMAYSSAIFTSKSMQLRDASVEKIDRLCRKLDLQADDHLLEIGSGWGALAVHAAKNYGCRVTTVTISDNQFAATQRRIAEQGLNDRVEVRLQDYRDIDGRFDKIVSVEMIEAVGHDHLDLYFQRIDHLLKPEGLAAIQAITIVDQDFDKAKRSVDFIKRYIFPGGFLPSATAMLRSMTRHTQLRLFHLEDIGFHYARTLEEWRKTFHRRLDDVRSQGYSDVFIRMWSFYLSYCEGAFLERAISDVQMVIAKPKNRTAIRF